MQNPLAYQTTEYDCGPTAILNAVRYLFRREDIPPAMIKAITHYTLEGVNENGETGKTGTSAMAMRFLSHWFNCYADKMKFPIRSEFLSGEDVRLEPGCPLFSCLNDGGAAVLRLWHGCGHYVTVTGVEDDALLLFDPYYRVDEFTVEGIETVSDQPCRCNRRVSFSRMNQMKKRAYALRSPAKRELMLIWNTSEDLRYRNTPENREIEEDEEDDDLE